MAAVCSAALIPQEAIIAVPQQHSKDCGICCVSSLLQSAGIDIFSSTPDDNETKFWYDYLEEVCPVDLWVALGTLVAAEISPTSDWSKHR